MSYDRYARFRDNGSIGIPPMVPIPKKDTDYYEIWYRGNSRLDLLSYEYYGDTDYEWLILMANPEVSGMEFEIPDGTELRIPYPLDVTINDYEKYLEYYRKVYDR